LVLYTLSAGIEALNRSEFIGLASFAKLLYNQTCELTAGSPVAKVCHDVDACDIRQEVGDAFSRPPILLIAVDQVVTGDGNNYYPLCISIVRLYICFFCYIVCLVFTGMRPEKSALFDVSLLGPCPFQTPSHRLCGVHTLFYI